MGNPETIFVAIVMLICFAVYLRTERKGFTKAKKELKQAQKCFAEDKRIFNEYVEKLKTSIEGFDNTEKQYKELSELNEEIKKSYHTISADYEKVLKKYTDLTDKVNRIEQEGQRRKKEANDIWESQIVSGYLPENTTIRDQNRRNFYCYLTEHGQKQGAVQNYISDSFGNAIDALSFAKYLREYFDCRITVVNGNYTGEYMVYLEGASSEKMNIFHQQRIGKYEFMNPSFDGSENNYIAVTEEQKELTAMAENGTYSTGEEYEQYVAKRLSANGYRNIKLTQKSGDYGADVLCEKNGIKYSVQCKMYSNPVGVSAIQEVYTSLSHYGYDKAMVITNSTFTPQAHKLAGDNGVILIDNFT